MKKYYTLFELDQNLKKWLIAFGDYSLEVVNQEKSDLKDSDDSLIFRVEMSGDLQREIEAKQDYLNTNWDFDLNRFKRTDKV
tara:strand:- start:487 stop:732 length:246 start_codon:yes stop_codon:yes gene_type:complete